MDSKIENAQGPGVKQDHAISRPRERSLSSSARSLLDSANSPEGSGAEDDAADTSLSLLHGSNASPLPQRDKPRSKPTIRDGKYVCDICSIKPFERRCEWNKHMDKHDRPYVCKESECSSLQGFTYSGGLLRHQREVHGLHGGAKLKLYCAIEGCKRKTQNPFTRRENLAEHMRRVHKQASPDPTSPHYLNAQYASDALPKLEEQTHASTRRSNYETTQDSVQSPPFPDQPMNTSLVDSTPGAAQPSLPHAEKIPVPPTAAENVWRDVSQPKPPTMPVWQVQLPNGKYERLPSSTFRPMPVSIQVPKAKPDEPKSDKSNSNNTNTDEVEPDKMDHEHADSDRTKANKSDSDKSKSSGPGTGGFTAINAAGYHVGPATPELVETSSKQLVRRRKRQQESVAAESGTSSPPASKKARRKSRSNGASNAETHDEDTIMNGDETHNVDIPANGDISANGNNSTVISYTDHKRRIANLVDHLSESRAAHKASQEALRQSQDEVEKLKRQLTDLVSAREQKRGRAAAAAAAAAAATATDTTV